MTSKHKWGELAKIFNLRLFEWFMIDVEQDYWYYFSESGLMKCIPGEQPQDACEELEQLLNGTLEVSLSRYTPKKNEKYWYIGDNLRVASAIWKGKFYELQRFALGNCFRSPEEANPRIQGLSTQLVNFYREAINESFYNKKEEECE